MSNFNVIKLNAIPSTSDYLKNQYDQGACSDGDLVWASDQTAGRGQRENPWESLAGLNLTLSVYKEFKAIDLNNIFLISRVTSIAVAEALMVLGIPQVKIKWPNDILSCDKKVGGILIENIVQKARLKATIIGIGMNVNQVDFPGLTLATSMAKITDQLFDLEKVFAVFRATLGAQFEKCLIQNANTLQNKYLSYLWKKDEKVHLYNEQETFVGVLRGVDNRGCIQIERDKGKVFTYASHQFRIAYQSG